MTPPLDWRVHRVGARKMIAFIASCAAVSAQLSAPPLPLPALETYPPAAHEPLASAYRNAAARPFDADAVCAFARLLHAWEQWDGAHQAYTRCQVLAPRLFDGFYLDALILQRLARHDAAVLPLRRALTIVPGYLPARVRLAEALLEVGSLTESREVFESLAGERSTAPAVELGLGRIAAAEGQYPRAVVHLERAIQLFPEFGTAYYALALSYRALGRTDEARGALARHAQFGPRWPALDDPVRAALISIRDDAEAHLQLGIRLAGEGNLAGAIAAHEAALARDPSLAKAHSNLITLYGQRGDFVKADEHYRAAVALGGNLSSAHYDYGVLLGMQEKWDVAAAAYRRALSLDPAYVEARNNLGQVLERQGQWGEAEAEYRHAVESQPTFRLARFNLGRMLMALGRNDEAAGELSKLLEPQDAETPRYLFALSTAHVRAGRKEEGIKYAVEARRLAVEYAQHDLAAAIDRELARLK